MTPSRPVEKKRADVKLRAPETAEMLQCRLVTSISDLQVSVLSHLHVSWSAIGQQEETPLSHGDFSHAAARFDRRGQLEDALAGLDVLQDRWWQAHLKTTGKLVILFLSGRKRKS